MARVCGSIAFSRFATVASPTRSPRRYARHKKHKKKVKSTLIRQLQRLRLHVISDDTEDGVETESDLFQSSSFSETGEDGDVEEMHSSRKFSATVRRKTSSSSKKEDLNSEEEEVIVDAYYPFDDYHGLPLPTRCQEGILEETFVMLSEFRGRSVASPTSEGFDDEGTLADVEDCTESERSDAEIGWRRSQSRYICRIWDY